MDKVICAICHFEVNKKCIKKNSTVRLNKKRICGMYEEDEAKLKFINSRKTEISTSKRPSWFWDKKEYVKEKKKRAAEEHIFSGNSEHPLTGNLDRFKSTAGREDQRR